MRSVCRDGVFHGTERSIDVRKYLRFAFEERVGPPHTHRASKRIHSTLARTSLKKQSRQIPVDFSGKSDLSGIVAVVIDDDVQDGSAERACDHRRVPKLLRDASVPDSGLMASDDERDAERQSECLTRLRAPVCVRSSEEQPV